MVSPRLPSSLLLTLLLPACAAGQAFSTKPVGNESFVSVPNVYSVTQAMPKAAEWCGRYGRVPKISGAEGYTVNFECVPKGT